MAITVIRRQIDATISVYRDEHHCGLIFCPCDGCQHNDYFASPWTADIAQRAFATDAEAIDYLVRVA